MVDGQGPRNRPPEGTAEVHEFVLGGQLGRYRFVRENLQRGLKQSNPCVPFCC